MIYLKFNCFDLASQSAELKGVYNKTRQLLDDITHVANTLDPQIKSYTDIQRQLTSTLSGISDIAASLLSSYSALDQIADIYHAAENKALREAENLPVGISAGNNATRSAAIPITSTSSINSKDLILEDWLAELVYKHNNKGYL